MGIQNCASETNIPTQSKYYFKQLDYDINSGKEDPNMKETCKVEVKIKNISSGKCKVRLVQYTDGTRNTILKNEGETEMASVDSNTNSIIFNHFYIMNYFFEKEQPIDFFISGSINGKVSTTLPSIMGSRGQTLIRPIEGGGDAKLEMKGFAYKNKESNTFYFKVSCNGKFNLKGINYTLKYLGTINQPKNNLLYSSEVLNPKLLPSLNFSICKIPDLYLAPDQKLDSNNIELAIVDSYHKRVLGKYTGPLSNLINKGGVNVPLVGGNAIISLELVKNYTFLDYIRGGMEINLTVGIDFTGSNGHPTKPNSLHYLGTQSNSYEIAIQSCGNIVAYYDYDQLFPVFGFGAIINSNSNEVNMCFNINFKNDPNIYTINNILIEYQNCLQKITFSGPTYFTPIIKRVIEIIKENNNVMEYQILMILTDGVINDMQETIDALVEGSFLPLSVIIIGIGDADFSNMDILDGDDVPLISSKGVKRMRDLVQFVPFKKFENNSDKLSAEVLEEIPRQIEEYYSMNNLYPISLKDSKVENYN